MTIGRKIQEIMNERNLTCEDLSEKLQVNNATIKLYLNDKIFPSKKLNEISRFLGTNIKALMVNDINWNQGVPDQRYWNSDIPFLVLFRISHLKTVRLYCFYDEIGWYQIIYTASDEVYSKRYITGNNVEKWIISSDLIK